MPYESISKQRHGYLRRDYVGNRSELGVCPILSYEEDVRGWARTAKSRMKEHCQGLLECVANPRLMAKAIDEIGRLEMIGDVELSIVPNYYPWEWLRYLKESILTGEFRRGLYVKHKIPKIGKQGFRTIEVPDDESRIISKTLSWLITPLLDPDFSELSFGFRPHRGVMHCLAVAEQMYQRGMRHLVCCDIRDAFGTIPKKRLLQVLRSRLHGSSVVGLMEELLDRERSRGIPQGLSLSPLCLNVYLDHFLDRWWARECPDATLVRYADDLVVFCDSQEAANASYDRIEQRVRSIGMKIKETRQEAIYDLDSGHRVGWLGFSLFQKFGNLKFSVAESSWCQLQAAFGEAKARQDRGELLEEIQAACIGLQWLRAKAPGFEVAQIGAIADNLRGLTVAHGFAEDFVTDDRAAEAWESGIETFNRARADVVGWLPPSCTADD